MYKLPGYILMEDEIYFYIKNKSKISSEILLKELTKIFKKKRFPIRMWIYDDIKIFAGITYKIDNQIIFNNIRKSVRAGMTKDELYKMIFNIINSEILLKSGFSKNEIEIISINNPKEVNKNIQYIEAGSEGQKKISEKKWKIPKGKILGGLNGYYRNKKKEFRDQKFKYNRSYFELPCVRPLMLLGGVPGKRNSGAKVIAFACICDGLTKKDAIIIGKHYHKRINSPDFPFNEVLDWINWVYNKKEIHWSCRGPQDIGECDKSVCWVVKDYYKKSRSFDLCLS